MNNVVRPVMFKPYKGLRPEFMTREEKHHHYRWSGSWFKSTNWSWLIRAQFNDPNKIQTAQRHGYGRSSEMFRSGGTALKSHAGCVLVSDTNRILLMVVRDPMERRFVLVNSGFDTPKVPRELKAFRSHWRKWMYQLVNQGTMIVKVNDEFLSNFKDTYNYAPPAYVRGNIQEQILKRTRATYTR